MPPRLCSTSWRELVRPSTPASDLAATVGQAVRNIQTMGKLAGTVIKSLPDLATFAVTTVLSDTPLAALRKVPN